MNKKYWGFYQREWYIVNKVPSKNKEKKQIMKALA